MKKIEEFDSFTRNIIESYVNNLFFIFPSLKEKITITDLKNIVIENLNHNIEVNCTLPDKVLGRYNVKEKKIQISNKISVDSPLGDSIIFHEMTHALTKDINDDEIVKKYPYIQEVLTTLIEKRFNKIIYKNDKKRINGYISDFGDQLEIVYGDYLLEQFLTDPKNMYKVFSIGISDEKMKRFLFKNFCVNMQSMINCIKKGDDDANIKYLINDIEEKILLQMINNFDFKNLSNSLEKLEALSKEQYYPNIDIYTNFIKKISKMNISKVTDEMLKDKENLKFIFDIGNENDKDELIDLYIKIDNPNIKQKVSIARKVFGFMNDNFSDVYQFFEKEQMYISLLQLLTKKEYSFFDIEKFTSRYRVSEKKGYLSFLEGDFLSVIYNNENNIEFLLNRGGLIYKKMDFSSVLKKINTNKAVSSFSKIIVNLIEKGIDISNLYINDEDFKFINESPDDFVIPVYSVLNDCVSEINIDKCESEFNIEINNIMLDDKQSICNNNDFLNNIYNLK